MSAEDLPMPDVSTSRAKTAAFQSVSLLPLLDVQTSEDASSSDLNADANPYVAGVFVDGIAHNVAVTISDVGLVGNSAFEVGDNGSLVILYEQRADGRGAAASPNDTATYANATLVSKSFSAGAGGTSSVTLNFRCGAVSGGSPVAWS
jgi:hypothetical protein